MATDTPAKLQFGDVSDDMELSDLEDSQVTPNVELTGVPGRPRKAKGTSNQDGRLATMEVDDDEVRSGAYRRKSAATNPHDTAIKGSKKKRYRKGGLAQALSRATGEVADDEQGDVDPARDGNGTASRLNQRLTWVSPPRSRCSRTRVHLWVLLLLVWRPLLI
eukprot:jgi/Chrzof1/9315/UNPLg00284.t1